MPSPLKLLFLAMLAEVAWSQALPDQTGVPPGMIKIQAAPPSPGPAFDKLVSEMSAAYEKGEWVKAMTKADAALAIAEAGGTVVKTMGDAVMAAFVDDETCARAAFGCLVAFDTFRKTTPHAEVTQLKLGVHGGPCYVVTANGTLDFFGQTVNVAARLQGLAESGEVVIEADALARLPVAMRTGLTISEAFQARVKGVAEPLTLVRVKL